MKRATTILMMATAILPAQTPNDPDGPVKLRRVEASNPPVAAAPESDEAIRQRVSKDIDGIRKSVDASPPAAQRKPPTPVPTEVRPEAPLSPVAQAAVRLSEKWLTEVSVPAAGPDGRVVYTYGAGLPTIVCAPLKVCLIELQEGERIVGEPHIGDSVRWNLAPAMFGDGPSGTTLIILKPQEAGLDTNLLITTDRRAYYIRLVSKTDDYVARISFAYPADGAGSAKWKEHLARQDQQGRERNRTSETGISVALEAMNFDYTTKGDAELRPIQVFDDGVHTFLRMSAAVRSRETPALVVVGRDGKAEMLNYRVKSGVYIADRLFDRAQLILGSGKKTRKAEVVRGRTER